jgi:hypothetical protein
MGLDECEGCRECQGWEGTRLSFQGGVGGGDWYQGGMWMMRLGRGV